MFAKNCQTFWLCGINKIMNIYNWHRFSVSLCTLEYKYAQNHSAPNDQCDQLLLQFTKLDRRNHAELKRFVQLALESKNTITCRRKRRRRLCKCFFSISRKRNHILISLTSNEVLKFYSAQRSNDFQSIPCFKYFIGKMSKRNLLRTGLEISCTPPIKT